MTTDSTPTALTPREAAAWRALHRPVGSHGLDELCMHCDDDWPCRWSRALDALAAAWAALRTVESSLLGVRPVLRDSGSPALWWVEDGLATIWALTPPTAAGAGGEED